MTEISTQTDDMPYKSLNVIELPIEKFHVTNKEYVDKLMSNIKWERIVYDFYSPDVCLPKDFEKGTRYISLSSKCGWIVNRIYEYIGESNKDWFEIIPERGYTVWIQKRDNLYIFDGINWINIGTIINHDNMKNIGHYSHKKIDSHIDNQNVHLCENMISHQNINDIGVYSHPSIDEHIRNSTNAHFGQNLTETGEPMFKSLSIMDVTKASHVVTKNYVDQKIMGIEWHKSIKTVFEPQMCIPTDPIFGERHICMKSFEKWTKNNIYEYDGSKWKEYEPSKNYAVYVESGVIYNGETIVFNGTEWVRFGSIHNHDSLLNCGVHNHSQIDEHISNNTNAHFNQDLKNTGSPTFYNCKLNGNLNTHDAHISNILNTSKIHVGESIIPQSYLDMSNVVVSSETKKLNNVYMFASDDNSNPINNIYMRSGGTITLPKSISNNTQIGSNLYAGYNGKTFKITSSMQCIATEDFNVNGNGSSLFFSTTENNSTQPKINMQIHHNGEVNIYCTNDCVSLKRSSLAVFGGLSVHKNILIGESAKINKNLLFDSSSKLSLIANDTQDGNDNKLIKICGGGSDNCKRGGMITISGNNSVNDGNVCISAGVPNGIVNIMTNNMTHFEINNFGRCLFNNKEDVSTTENGSILIAGGMNIGKNMLIRGNKMMFEKNVFSISAIGVDNDTQLNLCGGNSNQIDDGSFIQLNGNQNGSLSGTIVLQIGNTQNSNIRFNCCDEINKTCCQMEHNGVFRFNMTYNSFDIDSGSLIVDGGMSIKKKLNVSELHCISSMKLPMYSSEPSGEIGMVYYDIFDNSVKVCTQNGWKKLKMD